MRFILFFSIFFICLAFILSILFDILLWDSATALRDRTQPFLSGRYPFLRVLHLGIQLSLHPVSSLFGTHQQLTDIPVKSSTLPPKKMPVFQGVLPWHTLFFLFCVISLWDIATALCPVKSLYLFLSGRIMFPRAYRLVNVLTLSLHILLIKSICEFIVSVVYLYSKMTLLCNILFYVYSISIAKYRCNPKYFVLYVVYFFGEKPLVCRGV